MPTAEVAGLAFAWEARGDAAAPPLLLLMGLGMPLVAWPDALVDGLADRGFRVVLMDNRDCGHSAKIAWGPHASLPLAIVRAWLGLRVRAPYTLTDMAADTVGLLDALGIARAHVVGVSMGGMIGQVLAARHPDRVASLVSIMAASGNRWTSFGTPGALRAILRRPDARDADALVAHFVRVFGAIGSPAYATDPALLRGMCERVVRRGYHPAGTARQLLAVLASGDRRRELARIVAPTLVIHGTRDPVLPVAAGRDTARRIPGARLLEITGMGHDLPPALVPQFVEAIAAHCRAAGA